MCYFPFGIAGAALMAFLPPSQRAGKMVGNYFTNMVPSEWFPQDTVTGIDLGRYPTRVFDCYCKL